MNCIRHLLIVSIISQTPVLLYCSPWTSTSGKLTSVSQGSSGTRIAFNLAGKSLALSERESY